MIKSGSLPTEAERFATGMWQDTAHPNKAGHKWIVETISKAIGLCCTSKIDAISLHVEPGERVGIIGTAGTIRSLAYGQAAAVQYSSYALMMLVRLDPLDADTLDSLRAQALSDMKSGELQDSLQSYGAQLPHALDSAAMKKMPASKIKNEQ